MLELAPTTQFKKDLKRFKHKVEAIHDLDGVLKLLVQKKPLPQKNQDHPLSGDWKGSRECHVNPDILLIYRIDSRAGRLFLERFGSHSELF
jgi:mRNA interferase YafQ